MTDKEKTLQVKAPAAKQTTCAPLRALTWEIAVSNMLSTDFHTQATANSHTHTHTESLN